MVTVAQLEAAFKRMWKEDWRYEWGKHEEGAVDCSGAFVYAFGLYGIKYPNGSNRIARYYTVGWLIPVRGATIVPGMAAFAADPGAIVQMSGEITGDVPLAEGATVPTPMVEAAVDHFTAEGVDIDNIEPEGLAAWISEYQADNPGTANIEPKDLQAAITSYTADGASVPTPMVEAAIEHFTAEGVDTDNIEPEGLAAWIDQYQADNHHAESSEKQTDR